MPLALYNIIYMYTMVIKYKVTYYNKKRHKKKSIQKVLTLVNDMWYI